MGTLEMILAAVLLAALLFAVALVVQRRLEPGLSRLRPRACHGASGTPCS